MAGLEPARALALRVAGAVRRAIAAGAATAVRAAGSALAVRIADALALAVAPLALRTVATIDGRPAGVGDLAARSAGTGGGGWLRRAALVRRPMAELTARAAGASADAAAFATAGAIAVAGKP